MNHIGFAPATERWPSGRRRTPGKCVYLNQVPRVRIPLSPPNNEKTGSLKPVFSSLSPVFWGLLAGLSVPSHFNTIPTFSLSGSLLGRYSL